MPATTTAAPEARRAGGIDGMRAIAAGFVFLYHASVLLGLGSFMYRHWNVVGLFGPLGVCIFFVISGYLLYRPFVTAIVGIRTFPSVAQFWVRRVFRIFPAYWVALTIVWLGFAHFEIRNGAEFFTYFGLLQNYRTGYIDGGLDVAWTLVIEMSFYFVLPLFAGAVLLLARRLGGQGSRFALALGGAALWFAAGMGVRIWDIWFRVNPAEPPGVWFSTIQVTRWLPGYLHWFAGGMALAVAVEWLRAGHPLPRWLVLLGDHAWISWTLAALFLAADIAVDLPPNVIVDGTPGQALVITLCTPLFATFLFLPTVIGTRPSLIRQGVGSAPLAWMGLISYGFYLWHRPIMREINAHTSGGGFRTGILWFGFRYVIAFVASLALGAASYYLVERPCIALSHRFGPRRRAPDPAVATS